MLYSLAALALLAVPGGALPAAPAACTAPPREPVSFTPAPGTPFEVLPSADGCWVFVSLTDTGAIAVYRYAEGQLRLERVATLVGKPTGENSGGMVLTHDGKLLLFAAGDTVLVLNVDALESGKGDPLAATLGSGVFSGASYLNVSADDRILFVANETGGSIFVLDLAGLRADNFQSSGIIGRIPTGRAPVALTLSPDGSKLYSTSEIAAPELGLDKSCHASARPGVMVTPGEVEVIDARRAATQPEQAVLATAPGGCSPVRLILSEDGRTAFVTARGEDAVVAFDTGRLLTDPGHALLARATVAVAPVGIALAAGRLVVTVSNRFASSDTPQTLAVLSTDWHDWATAAPILDSIPAGSFPREERVSGATLLVTNFRSQQIEVVALTRIAGTH